MSFIKRSFNRISIILRDYYIDLRIQKRLIGNRIIKSINPEKGISQWQSTSYDAINAIFFKHKYVSIKEKDIIVDVGCGDGKLFNFLLYKGIKNPMLGYEINQTEGANTARALKKYQNITILCKDIFDDFPYQGTIFYMFNPFSDRLMLKFIDAIIKLKNRNPTIIYNNPVFADLFNEEDFDVSILKLHQYKHADGKLALIRLKNGTG